MAIKICFRKTTFYYFSNIWGCHTLKKVNLAQKNNQMKLFIFNPLAPAATFSSLQEVGLFRYKNWLPIWGIGGRSITVNLILGRLLVKKDYFTQSYQVTNTKFQNKGKNSKRNWGYLENNKDKI